jgi:hypothetical protein
LKFNSSLSIALTPGFEKLAGAPDNPLYLVDTDPIELCDLLPRHPVARQGADATELGDGYLAVSRLAVAFRSICFGSAAGSTFAALIGTIGRIAKTRVAAAEVGTQPTRHHS